MAAAGSPAKLHLGTRSQCCSVLDPHVRQFLISTTWIPCRRAHNLLYRRSPTPGRALLHIPGKLFFCPSGELASRAYPLNIMRDNGRTS